MKKAVIWFISMALAGMALLFCMSSCKTIKPPPLIEYRDRVTHDTITKVDSVYVSRFIREKGDTVFVTDTLFKFKYLDKVQLEYVHDSVPYEVETIKEVRKRNGYDKFVSWGFWILLAIALGRFAWWIFKTFYLRR